MSARPGSGAMFDRIAGGYDRINRVLSLGLDRRWRAALVAALDLPRGSARVLDLATGTADVAIAIARAHPRARVHGLDPSAGMLARGRAKLGGLADRVTLVRGDAQALPYPARRFDAASMAFGIRNVPDRARALAEAVRVLKPGARLAVLELGEPGEGLVGLLGRVHVRRVVPRLGALLSPSGEAYAYLADSVRRFPSGEGFATLLRQAGLVGVSHRSIAFGACVLYVGRRP